MAEERRGGEPHHFEITVTSWLHGADWRDGLLPQEIRAYSLSEALHLAAELPLSVWFPENYLDPEVPA